MTRRQPRRRIRRPIRNLRRTSNQRQANVPISTNVYRGPLNTPGGFQGRDTTIRRLTNTGPLTTSGAGAHALAFANTPSLYNQWSTWSTIFREYRVLGMSFHFEPLQQFDYPPAAATGPGLGAPWTIAWDSTGDVTPPTTHATLSEFASSTLKNTSRQWTSSYKMAGFEDAVFIPTAAPTATWSIKGFADAMAITAPIGRYLATVLVQFRGGF